MMRSETGTPPTISVVLSFRNEAEVIPQLVQRLEAVLDVLPGSYELIFVNDASTDDSLALLVAFAARDEHIKIINMARRFGTTECVLAGIEYARGEAVIYMDADLQDPPEVIPQLVEQWRAGADIVYTLRTERLGEPFFKMAATQGAYLVIRAISSVDIPVQAGDFRLLSKRVVRELLRLGDKDPYLRGLVAWLGFKQVTVPYVRQPRAAGQQHVPLLKNFFSDFTTFRGPAGHLLSAITSFSVTPLMTFLLVGIVAAVGASMFALLTIIFAAIGVGGTSPAALLVAILWLSTVQLLGIGVLALYLARVHNQVRNRPTYIVDNTIGFDSEESPQVK